MAKKKRKKSKLSKFTSNLGPGLFSEQREVESLERVRNAVGRFFTQNSAECADIDRQRAGEFLNVAFLNDVVEKYWWHHDRDHRLKGGEIKISLKKVIKKFESALKEIDDLDDTVKIVLRKLMRQKYYPGSDAYLARNHEDLIDLDAVLNHMNRLLECCRPITKKTSIKEAETCVYKTCATLVERWNRISGKEFKRQLAEVNPRKDPRLTKDQNEFEIIDAHFVHVILQAIDPNVTFSQVRNGLQRVMKATPKRIYKKQKQ